MKKEFLILLFFFSAAIVFGQSSKMRSSVKNSRPVQAKAQQEHQVLQNEKVVVDAPQKAVVHAHDSPVKVKTDNEDASYYAPADANTMIEGVTLSQYYSTLDKQASRIVITEETAETVTYLIDYSSYGIFGEKLQQLVEKLRTKTPFLIQATTDLKGALVTTPKGKVSKQDLSHIFLWMNGIKS